jgi:hypothetical protein
MAVLHVPNPELCTLLIDPTPSILRGTLSFMCAQSPDLPRPGFVLDCLK